MNGIFIWSPNNKKCYKESEFLALKENKVFIRLFIKYIPKCWFILSFTWFIWFELIAKLQKDTPLRNFFSHSIVTFRTVMFVNISFFHCLNTSSTHHSNVSGRCSSVFIADFKQVVSQWDSILAILGEVLTFVFVLYLAKANVFIT